MPSSEALSLEPTTPESAKQLAARLAAEAAQKAAEEKAARQGRALRRNTRAAEIMAEAMELNKTQFGKEGLRTDEIKFALKNKQRELQETAATLEKHGKPLTKVQQREMEHAIKMEIGAPYREAASKRRKLKKELEVIHNEGVQDGAELTIGGHISYEAAQAKNALHHTSRRRDEIARRTYKRVQKADDAARERKMLDQSENFLNENLKYLDEDISEADASVAASIENIKHAPAMSERHGLVDKVTKQLRDEVDQIRNNIERCEHPVLRGLIFKDAVLLRDDGSDWLVPPKELSFIKGELLRKLEPRMDKLNQHLRRAVDGLAQLIDEETKSVREEIQRQRDEKPKAIDSLQHQDTYGSYADPDSFGRLRQLKEANDRRRQAWSELLQKRKREIWEQAEQLIREWYGDYFGKKD